MTVVGVVLHMLGQINRVCRVQQAPLPSSYEQRRKGAEEMAHFPTSMQTNSWNPQNLHKKPGKKPGIEASIYNPSAGAVQRGGSPEPTGQSAWETGEIQAK